MTAYDQVPYPSVALSHLHPDRLEAVAALSGLSPASPQRCRMLEIGCGAGGNLIPIAAGLPEATFVGLDDSSGQIAEARRRVAELGLENVTLVHGAAQESSDLDGSFDYVVCQGVFSWVTPTTQSAILRLCRDRLTAGGVACINYNTLPGWQPRLALRDLLRQQAAAFTEPQARVAEARALLASLEERLGRDPFALLVKDALGGLKTASDSFLFHEYLEGDNRPMPFHEFVSQASAAGLAYVGEATFEDMRSSLFPERTRAGLTRDSNTFVRAEQLADFVGSRLFRSSLLRRSDAALSATRPSLETYHAACRIAEGEAGPPLRSAIPQSFEFSTEGRRRITVSDPLVKAAAVALSEAWPCSLPVAELLSAAGALLKAEGEPSEQEWTAARLEPGLLNLFGAGVLRLSTRPAPTVADVSTQPRAFAATRVWSEHSELVPNALHQVVALDSFERVLVMALDGTRDSAGLVLRLAEATQKGLLRVSVEGAGVSDAAALREVYAAELPQRLQALAARGLLIA